MKTIPISVVFTVNRYRNIDFVHIVLIIYFCVLLGPSEVGSCDSTISDILHLGNSCLDHLQRSSQDTVFHSFVLRLGCGGKLLL